MKLKGQCVGFSAPGNSSTKRNKETPLAAKNAKGPLWNECLGCPFQATVETQWCNMAD